MHRRLLYPVARPRVTGPATASTATTSSHSKLTKSKSRKMTLAKLKLEAEEISKKWKLIKEAERKKLQSQGAVHADVTLMYEVSARRKSQLGPHSLSAAHAERLVLRSQPRTMSDSGVNADAALRQ